MTLLPELLAARAPQRHVQPADHGAELINRRLETGLGEEKLTSRAGVSCRRYLLRGDGRQEAEALLEQQCMHVAETRDREAHADLISAFNIEAKRRGETPWTRDAEFHAFSNSDDTTHWGPARCLLVATLLPDIAALLPGLSARVPAADVAKERDRLERLGPAFFASLTGFQAHVLSSAAAAGQGAASANFAQDLPLKARPMAVYFGAARMLDAMLGSVASIDSTEHPILVAWVTRRHASS